MKRDKCVRVAVCGLLLILAMGVSAIGDGPARMKVLVPQNHVTYEGLMGGTIGAFCYRQSDDRFYISTYGANLGIRCYISADQLFPLYVEYPLDRENGKSWQCATESDLLRIASSVDVEGGLFNSDNPVSCTPSGMIINPAPVTVNGYSYGPGELAIISAMGKAVDASANKRMITWDFREIWSPTTKQPDRDNAEWDAGMLETDIFGAAYGLGRTNWNDAFNALLTQQAIADAIGLGPQTVNLNNDQVGARQAAFATDGSHVYFVSMAGSSLPFGGVWSVEMATRTVKRLFDNSAAQFVKNSSEPAVLPVGVRNLTDVEYSDPNTDQVLFNSTDITGNVGGLSFVVDDGSDNPQVQVALDCNKVIDLLEIAEPNYNDYENIPQAWSIATGADGTIYTYMNQPYVLLKYDAKGRLAAVAHRALSYAFNKSVGSTSTNTAYLRLQVRTIHVPLNADDPNDPGLDIPQAMFMSTAGKCVAGVDVYPTGDFNCDGVVTLEDMNFFKTQIQKTRSGELPLIADGQAYLDYIECDLNGNSELNADKSGLAAACVTDKDRAILYQFVLPGDANLDGCVDASDEAVVQANVGTAAGMDWSQGDFDFDDDVDADDLALLTANLGTCMD